MTQKLPDRLLDTAPQGGDAQPGAGAATPPKQRRTAAGKPGPGSVTARCCTALGSIFSETRP